MSYYDSTARQLDQTVVEQQVYVRERRSLRPLEGGHADERAREGVSPVLVYMVKLFSAVVLALLLAGGLNVAFTAGTVGIMLANANTTSSIQDMRAINDDLRNERSLLISADRIVSDATKKMGMVYASDARAISVDGR